MGLRRGEALGMRRSDLALEDGVNRISGQVGRTSGKLRQDSTKAAKIRPVPLPLIRLATLRRHRLRQAHEVGKRATTLAPTGTDRPR
ncbi:hypothetical protein GCM10009864_67400 [Streptomyces lunalinharesii]|uniref:Integrase n=1 Tax=Streptomyces lunalinharesii TaxID=333384 RepID=A0ABP6F649_9ACTN